MVRQAPVICVMAPPIHLGAWSMAMAAFNIIRVMPPIFGCGKLNSFPSTFMKINKNSSSPFFQER